MDHIPGIAYFCWSCDKSLRAFIVFIPMTMSLSDNCSSISIHSIDAKSQPYFLSKADLTMNLLKSLRRMWHKLSYNMWTIGHLFWNSNKNSSKTGKTSFRNSSETLVTAFSFVASIACTILKFTLFGIFFESLANSSINLVITFHCSRILLIADPMLSHLTSVCCWKLLLLPCLVEIFSSLPT